MYASRVERNGWQCTMQRRCLSWVVDDEIKVERRKGDRGDSQEELGPICDTLVAAVKQSQRKKLVETSSQASSNNRDED